MEARVDNQPNTPQPTMHYPATSVVTCPPKRGTLTFPFPQSVRPRIALIPSKFVALLMGVAGSCTPAAPPPSAAGRCQCAGPYADTMSRPCVSVVMKTIGGGEPMSPYSIG